MSKAQAETMPPDLADDGKPKVDVIELAVKLVMPLSGPRARTMVSTRENQAMAQALMALNQIGVEAAGLVWLLNRLGEATTGEKRDLVRRAEAQGETLRKLLETLDYMEVFNDTRQ